MKSRIVLAILGVTMITVVVLGIPLGIMVQRFYQGRAVVELQRRAALAVGEMTLPLDAAVITRGLNEADDPTGVSVYGTDTARIVGGGPAEGDAAVLAALKGQPASTRGGGDLIVATPIHDRSSEVVVGVVRVTTGEGTVFARVWRAWAVMGLTALAALGGAWAIARQQARRLTEPIERLRERARLLGAGVVPPPATPSGVTELDEVDCVLRQSGEQISNVLAREREFSSDVSHQLRTPLTRLSMMTERALRERPADVALVRIQEELDRTREVVEHLLALARDRAPVAGEIDPTRVLDRLHDRWQQIARHAGRPLLVTQTANLDAVIASDAALDQALDVLVDNALRHGAGTISLHARRTTAAVVFEVSDEGPGVPANQTETIFQRRATTSAGRQGAGIGLALARSIVDADDGRLLLARASPPMFQIVVRLAPSDEDALDYDDSNR